MYNGAERLRAHPRIFDGIGDAHSAGDDKSAAGVAVLMKCKADMAENRRFSFWIDEQFSQADSLSIAAQRCEHSEDRVGVVVDLTGETAA